MKYTKQRLNDFNAQGLARTKVRCTEALIASKSLLPLSTSSGSIFTTSTAMRLSFFRSIILFVSATQSCRRPHFVRVSRELCAFARGTHRENVLTG
jgi:hypothetical protein